MGMGLVGWTIATSAGTAAAQDAQPQTAPPPPADGQTPFSYERLIAQTRDRAKAAYAAPPAAPDQLAGLDRETYGKIRFKPEAEIWATSPAYRLQLFFPGGPYKSTVKINLVADGMSRPVAFDRNMFDLSAANALPDMPASLGFAGFRVTYPFARPDLFSELLTFLGFSYFRALGRDTGFGASARGLALNTGLGRPEEFPSFVEFWLQQPSQPSDPLTIFAVLDSPSVAGAFRFDVVVRENTRIGVDVNLFFRADVEQVGIAPLTGMFAFGSNDRTGVNDYRVAAYSTSGLSMWAGSGEMIWRPFVNPGDLRMSVFGDENPRGFGMLLRPRDAKAFEDVDSAFQAKPNVWVEPRGTWGKGSVRLIEIPTPDEGNQNIVAFWTPEQPGKAGEEMRLSYTLIWSLPPPINPALATVSNTRIGQARKADGSVRDGTSLVIVDFDVPADQQFPALEEVKPDVSTGNGKIDDVKLAANPINGGWRLGFTIQPKDGNAPIELRALLGAGDRIVSETWLYRLDKS